MDIFDNVFTLSMILFPAVFTLFVRPKKPLATLQPASTKFARMLWLSTGIAIAVYLLLSLWQPRIAYFMWFLFFPLWFLLAMPLLQARDPGWRPLARSNLRTASLERRDVLPPRLRAGWIAIIGLWGLLLCASVSGLAFVVSESRQWWLLFFNLAAGGELWLIHWGMGRSLTEAEPTLPHETDALRAERTSLHRFKLLGWFIVATLVMLIFSLPPLLLIWYGDQALMWAIAVGAGGGTLTGIGGGVFGTIASIKRAKINRLCLESSLQE